MAFDLGTLRGIHNVKDTFLMINWQSIGYSLQVECLLPHIIHCFHLHHAVLYLNNVNIDVPLAHFYGFCKVNVAKKASPVISGFDIFRP